MGKKKKNKGSDLPEGAILLVRNKRGRFDYELDEEFEAGLVLLGSEVKSLREKRASINEAHIEVRKGEAWLVGARIQEYAWANQFNHDPDRKRKLLLHRREIKKIDVRITQRGFSAIPPALYLKGGKVKLLFGIGRGKKLYEKRDAKKERDAMRDVDRARAG